MGNEPEPSKEASFDLPQLIGARAPRGSFLYFDPAAGNTPHSRESIFILSNQKSKVALLLSGSGTSLENLSERIDDGTSPAETGFVISSKPVVSSPGKTELWHDR